MNNPYEQYVENSVLTATPVQLVAILYRCGLESLADARRCLASGDIAGRGRKVSRAYDVLGELLTALDYERGGDISQRLGALYTYIQNQILMGHIEQSDERLGEAESLMKTLSESWEEISATGVDDPASVVAGSAVESGISCSY